MKNEMEKKQQQKKTSEELAGRETALTSFPPTTMENLILNIMAENEECPAERCTKQAVKMIWEGTGKNPSPWKTLGQILRLPQRPSPQLSLRGECCKTST